MTRKTIYEQIVNPHVSPRDTAVVSVEDHPAGHARSNQDLGDPYAAAYHAASLMAAYRANHPIKRNCAANHSRMTSLNGNLPALKTASLLWPCSPRSLDHRCDLHTQELQHI